MFVSRRYFLTAERFTAPRAREIGLLHEVVETPEELEEAVAVLRKCIMEAAPSAVAASKDLIRAVAGQVPLFTSVVHRRIALP